MDRARPVDPMVNFKFAVTIDDFEELGFMEVSGLVGTFDVIEYREGTDPITPRKLRGQIKFDNVVLKKGITNDTSMEEWFRQGVNIAESGNLAPDGVAAEDLRRGVAIEATNIGFDYSYNWELFAAWPVKFEVGSMTADASELLIDTLELACEGFSRELA